LGLSACLPSRVTIDLAPGDGSLEQRVVMSDDGSAGNDRDRGPRIALIDVRGVLSHQPTGGLIAGRQNAVDALVARLYEAERDPRIVAVLLRINSPGGTVAASETMYDEVRAFRERTGKPVVVSMAEVAASGGYYLALAADAIIAQESSITGSIGVIVQTFNVSEGLRRIGIVGRAVTSDERKALASPFEPIDEADYAILQGMVDDFYAAFTRRVAHHRPGIAASDLPRATDGRVFTGGQAIELGLVDALGGLRDAFKYAKQLAQVESASLVKFVSEGERINSAYALGGQPTRGETGGPLQVNLLQFNMPAGNEGAGAGLGFYYLWQP
jgi:protease-4